MLTWANLYESEKKREGISYEDAKKKFREENPGFSDDTYQRAISRALYPSCLKLKAIEESVRASAVFY